MDQQDPMAQETMQNVEPYGASLLRQFHEDCTCLLMEYDGALAPLDNPAVQQFMAEVMKTLERQFLMGAEKLFKKTYKQLPPLDGGEGDPAMTEEGPPPEDGGDMDDVVVEMDEEELPPEMSGEDFPAEVGEEAPAEAPAEEDPKKGEKSLTDRKAKDRIVSMPAPDWEGIILTEGDVVPETRSPERIATDEAEERAVQEALDALEADRVQNGKVSVRRKYVDGMGQEMAGGMNSEDPASSEPRRQPTPDEVVEGMQTKKQAKSIVFSITPIAGGKGFRVVENHGQKSLRADLTVKGINKYLTRFKGSGAKSLLDGVAKSLNAGRAVKFALAFSQKAVDPEALEAARQHYQQGQHRGRTNVHTSRNMRQAGRSQEDISDTLNALSEVLEEEATQQAAQLQMPGPERYGENGKSLCKNCKSADCKCGKSLKKSAQDVLPPGEEVDAAALHGQKAVKPARHYVTENTNLRDNGKIHHGDRTRAIVYDENGHRVPNEQTGIRRTERTGAGYDNEGVQHAVAEQALQDHRSGKYGAVTYQGESIDSRGVPLEYVLPPDDEFDPEELGSQPQKTLNLSEWAAEEEVEHQKPRSNDNQPAWVSLFDDSAKGALKLGYEFLTKLSMPEKIDLTDEDRLDAYHLHKMLEPVAVSGAKFLSGQKAAKVSPGDEVSLRSRNVRGTVDIEEAAPQSLNDPVRVLTESSGPQNSWESIGGGDSIMVSQRDIRENGKSLEDEGSKYLKSCGHCSSYLKMISREKAFGQPHRDEAGYLAKEVEKMLGALCPQGTKDVGEPSSEEAAAATMGQYELGDLEEKDLKALTEEVQAQEKQLDSLSKLFSSAR